MREIFARLSHSLSLSRSLSLTRARMRQCLSPYYLARVFFRRFSLPSRCPVPRSVRGLRREVVNPFSTEFQDPTEENFIKARSAIEISDSLKRKRERAGRRGAGGGEVERGEPTRRGLMPRRCNADNPALLISRSNLPGTCSVITSRRRITFLARISCEIIGVAGFILRLFCARAFMRPYSIYEYAHAAPRRINMARKTHEKRATKKTCGV